MYQHSKFNSEIIRSHWQYFVKRFVVRKLHICYNGSTNSASQLHAANSTWSYCVELPVQRFFLGISVDIFLSMFRR